MILSDFVTAWTSAKGRAASEVQRKAEASSSSGIHPAPIPKRTYTAIANSFREEHGTHPDNELPGRPLMDKTSAMAEDNDPTAVQLTEVASLEDGEDEVVYAACDLDGALKRQQRKTKKVPPPANPEGLRETYIVLENSFCICVTSIIIFHGYLVFSLGFLIGWRSTSSARNA